MLSKSAAAPRTTPVFQYALKNVPCSRINANAFGQSLPRLYGVRDDKHYFVVSPVVLRRLPLMHEPPPAYHTYGEQLSCSGQCKAALMARRRTVPRIYKYGAISMVGRYGVECQ